MKRRTNIEIRTRHPAAYVACGFMTVSAVVRLWHYLMSPLTPEIVLVHLFLPIMAAVLFIAGILLGERTAKPFSIAAVVLGFLPTKKLLYPLFGLPLLYHIFVEDMQYYVPPIPVWDWMPEISVLCIMAALFSLTFAMQQKLISIE